MVAAQGTMGMRGQGYEQGHLARSGSLRDRSTLQFRQIRYQRTLPFGEYTLVACIRRRVGRVEEVYTGVYKIDGTDIVSD